MKLLHLHVKKQYFEQIKKGEKTEEYRLVKPYYEKLLINKKYDGVMIWCGYPRKSPGSLPLVELFPWCGYYCATITHEEFGVNPAYVFAIRLVRDKHDHFFQQNYF